MKKYITRIGFNFINYLCILPLLCLLFFTDQDKEIHQLINLLKEY